MPSTRPSPDALRRCRALLFAIALSLPPGVAQLAHAQADEGGLATQGAGDADLSPAPPAGAASGAAQLLAIALPDDPEQRYALLQKQWHAALQLGDHARQIALLRQLADAGRGHPGGEDWILRYVGAEFIWGRSGEALAACEPWIEDKTLSLATRAGVALSQTYDYAQESDPGPALRSWPRADDLSTQVIAQGGAAADLLRIERLQVRSEVERRQGLLDTSLATLREAVATGRAVVAARHGHAAAMAEAYGWLDGSEGMLVYALLRVGRNAEAVEIAQAQIALWHAGQLVDSYGARWNYRLASALLASQQYAAGLQAAQQSETMLQRLGASPASHTRWLARSAMVRCLIGLKRWPEADQDYNTFLSDVADDPVARDRARDTLLQAMLAAKAGRHDEALKIAERTYRYRLRLYGAQQPATQEAAGVRGLVNLLHGDIGSAMGDYDTLFAATLDNPGGWLDLDSRGARGFVLGVAFDTFLDDVARQQLQGHAVDAHLVERARQVADHMDLGVTQRALADSTSRLLAATPALRDLLGQEQQLRLQATRANADLAATEADEEQIHAQMNTDAYKTLPAEQKKALQEQLRALREQFASQQETTTQARQTLETQRAAISARFPAYADLVTPPTASADALRALLAPDEALLQITSLDDATLVWLIGGSGNTGFAVIPVGAQQLAVRVATLRAALDLGSAPAAHPPALPVAGLHALYDELLGPLAPQLANVKSLIVATDGPLAALPLATLITDAPAAADGSPAWLVRSMAVTQLPSASGLLALRRGARHEPAPMPLIGFGDPLFDLHPAAKPVAASSKAPHLLGQALKRDAGAYSMEQGFSYRNMPPLPDTRAELTAIASELGADPQTDLVLGAAATRRAVLAAPLADRRVVAFATHGLMPGELPGISKPALAMAADAEPGQSPLLELDDVLELHLNADWVLLSACNSAAAESGGEAMSGLVRGFFFAGARSVLATHWAVESTSAAALTTATFAGPGLTRAQALRQAQLAMLDGSLGNGRWRHPFYWAPYALFGDPAR
jgi:CHAT domain-containing protein